MLPEFRLERFFSEWEFQARYHLTASDAESCPIGEILDNPADLLNLRLGYIPSEGGLELRTAIAATYSRIEADQVLAFCGAEEGLYCAMHALLSQEDHAIVTVPNYQAMEELPLALCGQVSGLSLRADSGWDLDLDELRGLLRPNTRLLAVNFPNNPTGKVLSQERWAQLLEIVRESQIWLFSDEVYRGLERNPAHTLPPAADLYAKALSLNVMSKAYGLPGLRIGWVACPDRDMLEKMLKIKHYLSICNSSPAELIATRALHKGTSLLERNRRLTVENLVLWRQFFMKHANLLEWWEPEGGCVAFPRYLGSDGVENWCRRLLHEAGVLFLPSSIYASRLGSVPQDRFRLGYGRRGLAEGLQVLRGFMR
ncbi:MAG: aminotransferase class I/II-fold pyridoxal phosphate-dependent enzyme [Candidatus Eremiobacteraeota bacterium]|nr:aminotransferase class I/II-fold pyridoxal phosphate-dependent enzyme [Candidatus Eremiobacteraeota bacterium]MCW5865800.1 aminotransferase class I/II-fold pyridoxal phosphate-dependent enzyme [Candidatus Eremiobacteraeota bacterium]